jgi:hypothetical protein
MKPQLQSQFLDAESWAEAQDTAPDLPPIRIASPYLQAFEWMQESEFDSPSTGDERL